MTEQNQLLSRGDAVNLARNLLADPMEFAKVTPKGVMILADAVMKMDAAIIASERGLVWKSGRVIPPRNGYYLAALTGDVASEAGPMLWMDTRWRHTDGSEVDADFQVAWWMNYPALPEVTK